MNAGRSFEHAPARGSKTLFPGFIATAKDPPVIVRLEEDRLLIDLRTVFPDQEKALIDAMAKALEG